MLHDLKPAAGLPPVTPELVSLATERAGRRYNRAAELRRLTEIADRMPAWEVAYFADLLALGERLPATPDLGAIAAALKYTHRDAARRLSAVAKRMPSWQVAYMADLLGDARGKGRAPDGAAAAGTPPISNVARPSRVDRRPGGSNRATGLQTRISRGSASKRQAMTNTPNRAGATRSNVR
ncbi:MAG: hypothetical protein AMXMBFR47_13810 [Planctomycetota bacterium]